MTIKNLTEEELTEPSNVKSEREWNACCSEVKAARSGQYPDDWYEKVLASGLANRVLTSFGSTDEIQILVSGGSDDQNENQE